MPDGQPTMMDMLDVLRSEMREGFRTIREELHTSLGQLRGELGTTVKTDAYTADKQAISQRISGVEEDVVEIKEQRAKDVATFQSIRQRDEDRKGADRRMVIGALITAVLSLLVALTVLAVQYLLRI